MSTIAEYRRLVATGAIDDDDSQRAAAEKLQVIHSRLAAAGERGRLRDLFRRRQPVAGDGGLYLYGDVGRGKSMLMDIFFAAAPLAAKRRVHFHAFMQEIHTEFRAARKQGSGRPAQEAAARVAGDVRLLCFDEFQVEDIADAMILGQLFEAFFSSEVSLVVTSNLPPDEQYKDGLNRGLFLPFVNLIRERLDLHHLEGRRDYRFGNLGEQVYFHPLGDTATEAVDALWRQLAGPGDDRPRTLRVQGREVTLSRTADTAARASFESLCGEAHGPADYLAIADTFRILVLDGIPRLPPRRADAARRFTILVDALYEARGQLVCSADGEPEELYPEGRGAMAFRRTASRLRELSSATWRNRAR